jgi:hypothetical protein
MPIGLTIALITVPLVLFTARAIFPQLPWKRYARTSAWPDIGFLSFGSIGLISHCAAMFYRDLVQTIPGTDGYVKWVNEMGWVSIVLYVLPASVVVVALRRQHPVAVAIVVLTFIAVGVTMYNGGPLTTHLTMIALAATALVGTTSMLVRTQLRREGPDTGLAH